MLRMRVGLSLPIDVVPQHLLFRHIGPKRSVSAGLLISTAIALSLSGCALPSSGPSAKQVIEQRKTETRTNYAMVDVNDAVLSYAATRPRESLINRFGAGPRTSDLRIAVGDVVGVNLWEAPPGSLFGGSITSSGLQQSTGG